MVSDVSFFPFLTVLFRDERTKQCTRCKTNHKTFEGPDCINEFGKWLYSGENDGCIAMAHNAKGYDAQFLLR